MFAKGKSCNKSDFAEYVTVILMTVSIIGTLLTIFGNSLVCIAVYKKTALKTPANYVIVSLSLASLLFVPVFISHIIILADRQCNIKRKTLCEWSSSLNFILLCRYASLTPDQCGSANRCQDAPEVCQNLFLTCHLGS